MAYTFKGSIGFGLVYIPVTLTACVKKKDISFHMLERGTMERIRYKKTSSEKEDEVAAEDIVKGYEYQPGKYVVLEDKDFEAIKKPKDKNITIEKFVLLSQIDPLYFEKAYQVTPTGGNEAYALLAKAMEEENKVGIARTVIGTKEKLIALRANSGDLYVNTLYFYDEVQTKSNGIKSEVKENELKIAKTLIEGMSGEFDIANYKDEYRERLMLAIEAKIQGKEIEQPKQGKKEKQVSDLMDALTKSLSAVKNDTASASG